MGAIGGVVGGAEADEDNGDGGCFGDTTLSAAILQRGYVSAGSRPILHDNALCPAKV